jgi:hypothetical protein
MLGAPDRDRAVLDDAVHSLENPDNYFSFVLIGSLVTNKGFNKYTKLAGRSAL